MTRENRSIMTDLFVEPFLGEFGWELFGWQSVLRAMSKKHRIYLSCLPGHQYLYQDFATDITTFDPGPREPNCHKVAGGKEFKRFRRVVPQNDNWLTVENVYKNGWKSLFDGSLEHEFIELGTRPHAYYGDPTILIHARATQNLNTGFRNWPAGNWLGLVDSLTKTWSIASIGTKDGAYHVPGTYDFRGSSLCDLCDRMTESPLVIGPTSGPMHLAALCGAPHLVWTGHKRSLERYQTQWNPFDTECMIYYDKFQWDRGEKWQPTVDEIIEGIREFDASLIRS